MFLFLAALCLLTSCVQEKKKYVIGVSQCSVDNWREKFNEELKTGALISDSLTIRVESANDNDQQQKAQINQLIDEGVDLLIVSPNQLRTISPVVDRAHEKGIPVILYDRKISSDKYTAFIGCDNYLIGRAMGQHIAGRLEGRGRIVEIAGLKGSSPAIERHRGLVDALKEWPGLELVASVAGDWKEESGARAMEQVLKKTMDFDFVLCHNDRMAIGAREAALKQGLDRYRYTGVDGLATAGGGLELVRDGKLDATYLYPTKGGDVINLAMNILTGRPFQRENYLQTSIVTQETADLSLMEARDAEDQRANLGVLHQQVDSYMTRYRAQRFLAIVLALGVVLLIVFVVTVYRSLIVKARLNEQLAESNKKLKQLNEEIVELTTSRLTFFTNISHELRTPLTLITDPVNRLLSDDKIVGRNRALLELIKRNAVALQQLVDAILDFRKIQNGKMELDVAPIELPVLLEQWVTDFEPTAERKEIHLHLDTSDFGQKPVMTDAEKLARIVFNLMSNALKYTPADGHVYVTLTREPNDMVRISVRDTGKGIKTANIEKVFERFFQAKGSAAGTGIGLTIVKSYAELLGGGASVTSKEGEGAEFVVTIKNMPISTATDKKPAGPVVHLPGHVASAAQATPLPTGEGRGERLLVIDDNDDIRQYIVSLLSDQYQVLEAVDGQQGLDLATEEIPDLVLCDVMMPVMNGLEFCHKLKTQTATSHIPVILLTAKNLEKQRAEGYEYGADSYITKPFDTQTLLKRISNLLKQRETLRQYFGTGEHQPISLEPKGKDEKEQMAVATSMAAHSAPALGERDRRFMDKLQTLIDTHLSDSYFNVEAFGQEVGLSRVQLYRKVKALTGSSVVELLRKARLAKAKTLLLTTDKSVSEVAYEVGFSAPSYFTKCFRDEYGMTPGECASKA